jgi:hypothetical protein
MKTKTLIELLQKADPTGEEEVCVGNVDIHFVDVLPAYWDGNLQVLERDENKKYYNIIGAKYRRSGSKIVINTLSIADAICNDVDLPVDYSGLSESQQATYKQAHDNLRIWYRNMENGLEEGYFVDWAIKKAKEITPDIEEIKSIAQSFFKDNLDRNDPLPSDGKIPTGESYHSTREKQWDSTFCVSVDDGFLEIKKIELGD